jgi:tRNA(adenine34) deaminase
MTKDFDTHCIARCIALSQESIDKGDAPFGTVIAHEQKIIVEALNDYNTKISEHAEIVALNTAHALLGTSDLGGCTLYTNVEPCPMCAFMIREFKISRVVFALPSPYVGGYTKWQILQDTEISTLTPYFTSPPEVIGGILEREAKDVLDQTPLWMFGSHVKKGDEKRR